ncbi:MAG: glycosyltransferase family 4 protein [Thermotogae bacterium]|nr:glycosyltransferase family 4 protein [Thermotogota bacterium]
MRLADIILVQNHLQLKAVKFKFPQKRVFVLPNLQDVPTIPSFNEGEFVMWISAGSKAAKRPEIFVRLAKDLPHIPFVMVGVQPEDPSDNLRSFPRLNRRELMDLMDRASILVITSKPRFEGIPNVVLEAMLRGVPVLSLEGDYGLVHRGGVVVRDYHELKRAVERLWKDMETLQHLSVQARNTALDLVLPAVDAWQKFCFILQREFLR